jgi:hydroxymethylglutaryl-CoA synthase
MNKPSSLNQQQSLILKPDRSVGIIGYGAYVPRYRLPASEVARIWTGGFKGGFAS